MISEKSIQTLELTKILDHLARHTTFAAGAQLARELRPTTILDEAKSWQRETAEARLLFENKVNVTLGGARDVREPAMQATRGVLIEAQTMLDIRYTLRRATTIKRTLGRMKGTYPLLSDIANEAEECAVLQEAIARVLNDKGEILDTASPQLAIIRRDLKVAYDKLQTRLTRLIGSSTASQFLQEALITTRNGRYVIPIKAEFKGRIPGIVHDSSSSGATLFIEPLATVELNNTYRELQLAEEKEIRRILQALTDQVGAESEHIVRTVEVLAYLDLTFAKALYAEQLNATEPVILPFKERPNPNHPGSAINLRGARHPLLTGSVVPIDVELDEATWVLVVTGPNTGGKTVSLKTIGLLVLMAQCGLQVPAEDAKLTVFEGVYADIGDEQSIEQSLSTFSSHMTNTIQILRECDARTLVLLDELGAGTDPAEGSALARAILTHLVNRHVTTIVTTHHPELKVYSVETSGVRNASVEFDLATLRPTYRLIIGLPGRSNALAIATRLGLDMEIIENARTMVTTENLVADDMLDEIQRTREDIRKNQLAITALREEIEEQRAELQARLDKIEDERRDIIASARRQAEGEIQDFQREVKRLRNDLRGAALPLDNLRALQDAAANLSNEVKQPVPNEVENVADVEEWKPRLGENVWLPKLNAEGAIVELEKEEAVIQVGTLKVRAHLTELSHRTRSEKRAIKRGHKREYEKSPDPIAPRGQSPGFELDLRGERVDEALKRLETYIDAAYMSGLPFARIIHGKGTGALRKAVQERVGSHPLISKVTRAEAKEGGEGVTIIHMVPLT
jgi:DNA mismatch repair protein MutS2